MNKDIINQAIQNKQVLEFYYDDKQRIVEPYAIGKTNKNKVSLLSIQIGGHTSSSKLPDWRMFEIDKTKDIKIHKRKFATYFQIYQNEAENQAQPLHVLISEALDIDRELISNLQNRFDAGVQNIEGRAYWLAKDLRKLLGYSKFSSIAKMIDQIRLGAGPDKEKLKNTDDVDILSARYCLEICKKADFKKEAVRFGRIYFANEVNKELSDQEQVKGLERIKARMRLAETERYLSSALYEHGADDKNLSRIRSAGDSKLFGASTARVKEMLNAKKNQPLSDLLPDILIKAKEFAAALTNYNISAHNIKDIDKMRREHIDNNSLVRYVLSKAGIALEDLLKNPPQESLLRKTKEL